VSEERRKLLLQALNSEPQPLDANRASAIMAEVKGNTETEEEDPLRELIERLKTKTKTQETAAPAADRQDIGPLSTAEHERLKVVITDLTAQNNSQKIALASRNFARCSS
jgi:hypothetical protein